jgi:predicted PurR-regulated permease PerM
VALIVAEHFLGIWGLVIGVPLLMFMLDLLDVGQEKQS